MHRAISAGWRAPGVPPAGNRGRTLPLRLERLISLRPSLGRVDCHRTIRTFSELEMWRACTGRAESGAVLPVPGQAGELRPATPAGRAAARLVAELGRMVSRCGSFCAVGQLMLRADVKDLSLGRCGAQCGATHSPTGRIRRRRPEAATGAREQALCPLLQIVEFLAVFKGAPYCRGSGHSSAQEPQAILNIVSHNRAFPSDLSWRFTYVVCCRRARGIRMRPEPRFKRSG